MYGFSAGPTPVLRCVVLCCAVLRAGGLHFSEDYGRNSSKLGPHLEGELDALLALLVGDLAYAV